MHELTALVVLALMSLIAVALMWRNRKREWLSHHVQEVRSQVKGETTWQQACTGLANALRKTIDLLNSGKGFISILLVIAIIYGTLAYISGIGGTEWLEDLQLESFLGLMWQVHAAIIGIAVVVVVLLVQSVREEYPQEAIFRLYLRRSSMLAIVFFGLATLLSTGLTYFLISSRWITATQSNPLSFFNALLFCANVLFTGALYARTVRFLAPAFRRRAIVETVKEDVRRMVEGEVSSRLATAILREKCKEWGLGFARGFLPRREGMIPIGVIDGDGTSVVVDVNLDRLELFARRLNTIIQRTTDGTAIKGYLVQGSGAIVQVGKPLAVVHTDDYNENLARLLRRAYKLVQPTPNGGVGETIAHLKAQLRAAVRGGEAVEVERILHVYATALAHFLEETRRYRVRFTPQTAREVFFLEWQPIWLIERDLYDVIASAFQTRDWTVIRALISFPARLMRIAAQANDHLVFQTFTRLYVAMYRAARELLETPRERHAVVDSCWRHFVEFSTFYLERRLYESDYAADEVGSAQEYYGELIGVFNQLLKYAGDVGDFKAFDEFGKAMDGLFALELLRDVNGRLRILEAQLESQFGPADMREQHQREYEKLMRVKELRHNVNASRRKVWLGLGGWITNSFMRGAIGAEQFKSFFNAVSRRFTDLKSLSEVFFATISYVGGVELDWTSWDMSTWEETPGRIRTGGIRTEAWLTWYYCLQGLRLTPATIDASSAPITPTAGMEHQLANIAQICQTIQRESSRWAVVVDVDSLNTKIENFLTLHNRAIAQQRRIEEDALIEAEINPEKWLQFQEDFVSAWRRTATMRVLIQKYGDFVDKTHEPPPPHTVARGINVRDHKGAYVDLPGVHYVDWGGGHGRMLGGGEDALILTQLPSRVNRTLDILDSSHIGEAISYALRELRDDGYVPSIILLGHFEPLTHLRQLDDFLSPWQPGCPPEDIQGYEGTYKDVPLFMIPVVGQNVCFALDLKALATLVQYQVPQAPGQTLWFDVRPFDDNSALDLIRHVPELRRDKATGRFRKTSEVVRELKMKVHLRVLENFELLAEDENAGYRITWP